MVVSSVESVVDVSRNINRPFVAVATIRSYGSDQSFGFLSRARILVNGIDADEKVRPCCETDESAPGGFNIRSCITNTNNGILDANKSRLCPTCPNVDIGDQPVHDGFPIILDTRILDVIPNSEGCHVKGVGDDTGSVS